MKLIRKLVDFYLYSSIHIALGAGLSVFLCYAMLTHIPTSDYPLFVFCATLFLYSGHRIIGINKVKAFENEGRFAVIKKFKSHLILYAILSGLGSLYFYISLSMTLKLCLLIPGLVSVAYVIPIFGSGKRLRDFNLIKIFLIAIIWGLVIGVIPYIEVEQKMDLAAWVFFLEKIFFIFAITLPFDARDLEVDRSNSVKTIPSVLGLERSYNISYLSMLLVICCVITLFVLGIYTSTTCAALGLSYLLTMIVIRYSKGKKDDYYYSGLLDGTISLVGIAGILGSELIKIMF